MIKKVFIDSDIILDVATGRTPFVHDSRATLAYIENGKAMGYSSANSIANIYYILRKISTSKKARAFIKEILKYISILPVTHTNILDALDTDFPDLEDAMQDLCAFSNQCECIVTRNIKDYRNSKTEIYNPREFIALFKD